MTNESALFTRLAQTHRPDCLLSLDGPPPQPAPDPGELARTLGSDAVAAYASACRPIYEDLRRIIGQCAGLAILARLTSRNEIRDLPELAQCEARWKAAAERLGRAPRLPLDLAARLCGPVVLDGAGGLKPVARRLRSWV